VADEANQPVSDGAVTPPDTIALADLKATLGDSYFNDKGFDAEGLKGHLAELGTLKQQAAERAAGIPQDGKYTFDLPADFKLPEGLEWKPDEKFTAQIAELAKSEGLTQAQLSKLTVAYAQQDLAKKTAAVEAAKADDLAVETEAKKLLGDAYVERTANVRQAMQGVFGEQLAKNISFQCAADILAMEKFLNDNKSRMAPNAPAGGGSGAGNNNEAAVALVGTPDGGRKLLDMANNAKASN
jgi:hypothetical protein